MTRRISIVQRAHTSAFAAGAFVGAYRLGRYEALTGVKLQVPAAELMMSMIDLLASSSTSLRRSFSLGVTYAEAYCSVQVKDNHGKP